MTKPRMLWIHEGEMYMSIGATRREAVDGQHPGDRKFLEKLLGARLESFQKQPRRWPQTYPVYFRVVR